jgi:hypothetical protein
MFRFAALAAGFDDVTSPPRWDRCGVLAIANDLRESSLETVECPQEWLRRFQLAKG